MVSGAASPSTITHHPEYRLSEPWKTRGPDAYQRLGAPVALDKVRMGQAGQQRRDPQPNVAWARMDRGLAVFAWALQPWIGSV